MWPFGRRPTATLNEAPQQREHIPVDTGPGDVAINIIKADNGTVLTLHDHNNQFHVGPHKPPTRLVAEGEDVIAHIAALLAAHKLGAK